MSKEIEDEEFLTIGDVAEILCLSKSTAYKLVERAEDFPLIKMGGFVRIPKRDFYIWINEKRRRDD